MTFHGRTLRYPAEFLCVPAQEKGIDVMLALDLVEFARSGQFEVVVLASHD